MSQKQALPSISDPRQVLMNQAVTPPIGRMPFDSDPLRGKMVGYGLPSNPVMQQPNPFIQNGNAPQGNGYQGMVRPAQYPYNR